LTDHFPTFLITNDITNGPNDEGTTFLRRNINEDSIAHFRNLLLEINWELIFETNDTNHA